MIRNAMLAGVSAMLLSFVFPGSAPAAEKAAAAAQASGKQVSRGRYLLAVGNCNDCHTPGFAVNDGNVPEKAPGGEYQPPNGPLNGPFGTAHRIVGLTNTGAYCTRFVGCIK